MNAPICRSCQKAQAFRIGSLPDVSFFAGRRLEYSLPGGALWRCRACNFVFRHPLLAESQYQSLYENGALDVWDAQREREDFRLIRGVITEAGESSPISVLDVGCYTGQLLATLPPSCQSYGIEPNRQAAAAASSRGIRIVGTDASELKSLDLKFDFITACDVIEHFPDPLKFLRTLAAALRPGGKVIVSTGNSDAWLWQVAGARFWYCHYPEHISFLGARWLASEPSKAGLKAVSAIKFNYVGSGPRAMRAVATLAYRASPTLYRKLEGRRRRNLGDGAPPGFGASRDHILCVLRLA
jgi:SAM-dependent methyltransferase